MAPRKRNWMGKQVMTTVNNLIRLARATPRPTELTIKPSDVSRLATHERACHVSLEVIQIEDMIWAGSMRFLGIPLRVLGPGRP